MLDIPTRIRGCLLGGAVGDALGAPVEFLSLQEIRARFGPDGPAAMAPYRGRRGGITDDTQMTMFTIEGLIRAWVRGTERGICDVAGVVHHAYLRWLDTQRETSSHPLFAERRDGWLFGVEALHHRRAPGNTCVGSLRAARSGSVAEPLNDSKGCGGLMRIAPVGLWPNDPFTLGCDIAALTHGHPSGYLAAGFMAELVHSLVETDDLKAAIDTARRRLQGERGHAEVLAAVDEACGTARRGRPSPETLEGLGAGWVAEEALAIALCCALAVTDFEAAVRLAVTHSGDSDSTGCITGAMLGAWHGPDVIPEPWLRDLELREELEILAADYARVVTEEQDVEAAAEELAARYPGW